MWKSIVLFGGAVLFSIPAFAQESLKYTEIPLQLLDKGVENLTIGDKPNFLRENRITIQQPLHMLDKVERMPIAKGPNDFNSNMPLKEFTDSLNYNMPIYRERKDW